MSHIFISYAREDYSLATMLQQHLERLGFITALQPPHVRYRQGWQEATEKDIADSFVVIVVVTRRAAVSSFVEYEWDYADRLKKHVLPIVFEPAEDLYARYRAVGELDFTDSEAYPWRQFTRRLIRIAQAALAGRDATRDAPLAGAEPLEEALPPGLNDDEETKTLPSTQRMAVGLADEVEQPAESEPVRRSARFDAEEPTGAALPPSPVAPPEPAAPAPAPGAPPPPAPQPLVRSAPISAGEPAGEVAEEKEVRFTAFGPKEAAVETWYTLLAYAHTAEALDSVRADADRFRDEMGGTPREVRGSTPAKLARGTEITMIPTCEGLIFNPERITFRWFEDLHRADFRFKADQALAGAAGNVVVTVYVGPVIVASLRIGILFSEQGALPVHPPEVASTTADLYRAEQIFISYSHADTAVVRACRNVYKALGYNVLIDIDMLRAGQNWNEALMRMIDQATIFQLFWSERSAKSQYVRQEWEYALRRSGTGEGFIRPVHWEDPLVPPPPELGHLHFTYIALPRLEQP